METKTDTETRKSKVDRATSPKTFEEEVKSKAQEKRSHDGSEANTREVDCPVTRSDKEGGEEGGTTAMKELTT